MPTYNYTARDRSGHITRGVMAATDIRQVREQLRQKDLYLTSIRQKGRERDSTMETAGFFMRCRVKLNDMVVFSRQFATLVGSGMPIVECLFTVAAQTENRYLVSVINEVRKDVLSGITLTEAMSRHPNVFSELYIALVRAGEAGGVLEETLETAARQLDKEAELREKVRSAFVYPTLVVAAAVGVVAFLLTFVIPVFANVYTQFNARLPTITLALIATSDFTIHYWWIIVPALVVMFYLLRLWVQTERGKRMFDRLKLKLPFLGKLNRKIAIARFTRTLAAMVRAGVPILGALGVSGRTSGNTVIIEAVTKVAQFVKEGAKIWIPLEQTGEFPTMVTRMIASGEESGNLDEMLEKLSDFYDRDIEYTVGRLTRLLEPLMTVIVGGIVLFVLLALYSPIFNLTRVIKK